VLFLDRAESTLEETAQNGRRRLRIAHNAQNRLCACRTTQRNNGFLYCLRARIRLRFIELSSLSLRSKATTDGQQKYGVCRGANDGSGDR
jgi:hypothetical protein